MRKIDENDVLIFLYFAFLIIGALIAVALIVLRIYCLFAYGSTPVQEMPSWAAWIMFAGRN